MVENKGADYVPLLGASYEDATAPYEDAEEVQLVTAVQPSAPTEEAVLVHLAEAAGAVAGHSNENTTTTATTTTRQSDRDRLAEEAAAEAREQGVALIRTHLGEYLIQNPDANYVTWIATLHPENAEVTIDPRFLIPGNPWATVFEEARTATLMGVHETTSESSDNQGEETKNDDSQNTLYPSNRNIYLGGLIPMIVGFSILLGAIAVAFALQLTSTILYLFAVLFHCICRALPRFSLWTAVLYLIPGGLLFVFQALDILLLVLDTVLVELLALLAYVLCTPLAFSHAVGVFYHQQIRRLPHFIRWACRKPLIKCNPPRASFPRVCAVVIDEEEEEEVRTRRLQGAPTLLMDDDDSSAGGVP